MKNYKTVDYVLIALLAAIGIASKPIFSPIANVITDPFMIPGGSTAGGLYMIWLVVGTQLIKKPHTATLIGSVQGMLAIITGVTGFQGLLSLVVYTLPGVTIDLVLKVIKKHVPLSIRLPLAGLCGNLTGTFLTNLLFFRLKPLPCALFFCMSILSGCIGGYLSLMLTRKLQTINLLCPVND